MKVPPNRSEHDAAWFKAVLNAMRDLVFVKGPKSEILWANRAFRDYYGIDESKLARSIDEQKSDPDDTLQYLQDDKAVFDTKTSLDIPSETITDTQGVARAFHTVKSPVLRDSEAIAIVGVARRIDDDSVNSRELPHADAKSFLTPLRAVTENVPLPMLLLDVRERMITCSPSWTELFRSKSGAKAKTFATSFPELAQLDSLVGKAITDGVHTSTFFPFGSGDKQQFFEFRINPWRYPDGSVGGVTVIASDVTQLKRGELELAGMNQRLNLALSASNVGVWDWLIQEDVLVWDDRMHALYGTSKKQFNGAVSGWSDALHPDYEAFMRREISLAMSAQKKFDTEFTIVLPDGAHRMLRSLAEVTFDRNGTPIRMTGINWDVTADRLRERQLREANTRYELMVQGSSVGIWDWPDMSKDEEYWSPRFYELLGYNDGEIEASNNTFKQKLIHPDDTEPTYHLLDEHLATGIPFDTEYRLRTKSGEYRWFRVSGQAAREHADGPVRMAGSIQDIHERVVAEKELRRSNDELEQFAYIASHDLREPLRGMRNFAQFLIEDYSEQLDEEGRTYLDTIRTLGDRLEKYLDSLLFFSRLGREEMSYQQVELRALVTETIETYFSDAGPEVEFRVQADMPVARCDPLKLSLVFRNLIQNAIRYNTNAHKRVELSCSKKRRGFYRFIVKDNGIGMKPDHWKRIFTLFKRLHPKDEFAGGTGIGLTLVKKAVERHGGEIWVEDSKVGSGTTIAFTIQEAPHGAK